MRIFSYFCSLKNAKMKPLMPLMLALAMSLAAPAQGWRFEFSGEAPRMVLLSRPYYAEALQPFVEWKRQCGFEVYEVYVPDLQRDSARRRVQELYDSLAPRFLLLAGGSNDLIPFLGTHTPGGIGTTLTDLPYADPDGDGRPEMLMGRWPAWDEAGMREVVRKTIEYESFHLQDSTYLRRVLLLAGNESRPPAPELTNGQLHTLAPRLAARGLDTACLYNPALPEASALWQAERKDSVIALLEEGNALVCYTGHGEYNGWRYPRVDCADVRQLPADGMCAFYINNCCRTSQLTAGNTFAEQLLCQPAAGAVGVVGSVNETLWQEDYDWAMGLFDAWIEGDLWLAGQMVPAANGAVEADSSVYAEYYWEMYHLYGDPSMQPWLGLPQPLELVPLSAADTATLTLEVAGTPGAYVALAERGELLATCLLDAAGRGHLLLPHTPTDSLLYLSAQMRGHRPHLDTLQVIGYQPPLSISNSQFSILNSQSSTPKVYPNPAREELRVECDGTAISRVEILDLHGRLILHSQSSILHLHTLSAGLYLLRVTTPQSTTVQRLIIHR